MGTRRARGALAVGMLVLAYGCGGSKSSTAPTTVQNPTITSMSVSPTFGVSGLTNITMSATATDPANSALTYTWTYGSATATGATNTAKLTGDGSVTVQLKVTNAKGGSATDSRSVTIGTMTGTWLLDVTSGSKCGAGRGEQSAVLTLKQDQTPFTCTDSLRCNVGLLTEYLSFGTNQWGSSSGIFFPEQWCNATRQTAGIFKDPMPWIDEQGNFRAGRITVTSGSIGAYYDFNINNGKMDSTGRKINAQVFDSGFSGESATLTKQ
jgi:hypothetical protein